MATQALGTGYQPSGRPFDALWSWLRRRGSVEGRAEGLLDQFYATLSATYQQIRCSGQDLTQFADITTEIEDLLTGERSWRNAYQIEQLMVPLYAGEKLDVELERRLLEAEKINPPVSGYYSRLDLAKASEEHKRALLARLVNDLQWRYETRQVEAYFRRVIAKRTSNVFVAATGVFLLVTLFIFWASGEAETASFRVVEWKVIVTSLAAGLLGAAFSMLLNVNARASEGDIEDLKSLRRLAFVVSRIAVGIGASLIVYYLITAEMMGDAVFLPKLDELYSATVVDAEFRKNYALLVMVCFIAGFSERLVPNLLKRSEGNLDAKQAPPPRPTTTG